MWAVRYILESVYGRCGFYHTSVVTDKNLYDIHTDIHALSRDQAFQDVRWNLKDSIHTSNPHKIYGSSLQRLQVLLPNLL